MSNETKEWVGTDPVTFRDARECAFAIHGAMMLPGGIGEATRYVAEWTKAQHAALYSALEEVRGALDKPCGRRDCELTACVAKRKRLAKIDAVLAAARGEKAEETR